MRILIALAFLLVAPLAQAATFTITFNTPAGNFTKSYTVPDAHAARLYAAIASNYSQPVVTGQDAQGNAITRPPTRAEVMTRWADGFLRGLRDSVLGFERQEAAATAAAPIAPITVPTIDATP